MVDLGFLQGVVIVFVPTLVNIETDNALQFRHKLPEK